MPQINLAVLFGEQSHLPFYYRKLPGNIPDVKTLKKLLADMNTLDYEKFKVILDRRFFSTSNINDLYKHYMKFLIAAKTSLKLVKDQFDASGMICGTGPTTARIISSIVIPFRLPGNIPRSSLTKKIQSRTSAVCIFIFTFPRSGH